MTSYSNYGYVLAGYLVRIVSGMPFADYVAQHIFRPLGMTRSTVAEPLPAAMAGGIATAYRAAGRQQAVAPVQYGFEPPAGDGNAATVTDMGRFMLANLQGGAVDGHRLMSAAALQLMQRTAFLNDPRIPGMTYGFEQGVYDGWPLLGKGGDVIGTHADLTLIPSANTGIYVVYNGEGTGGGGALAAQQLVQRFIDNFLPRKNSPGAAAPGADVQGTGSTSRFVGDYRTNRFSHTTFTKLAVLFQAVTVITGPGGTLTTTGLSLDPAAAIQHWIPAGDGLFREQGGQGFIAFGEDRTGNVTGPLFFKRPLGGLRTASLVRITAAADIHDRGLAAADVVHGAVLADGRTGTAPRGRDAAGRRGTYR